MIAHKKAFLFDMDGLLIDSERIHLIQWEELFERENIDVGVNVLVKTIGSTGDLAREIYRKELGDPYFFDKLAPKKNELLEEYLKIHGMPAKKGAKELLEYLDKQGIFKVVVSSSCEDEVEKMLSLAGLSHLLPYRVCGNQVKYAKPAPDIFLKAVDIYGLKKEECLILEDSRNGIMAANSACIDVIGIPDIVAIDDIHVDHLLGLKSSLLDILEELENQ